MKKKIYLLLFLSFTTLTLAAQKKSLFDRLNNGLDKVNNGLNKALGYKTIQGEWVRHGGGCWNSFGGFYNEQAMSPLNKTFEVRYGYAGTPYGISLSSSTTKYFGFAIVNPYGEVIHQEISQGQANLIEYIFTPTISGVHKIIVFTARIQGDPLNDPGGKFVFSAQCENISPVENGFFIEENLTWGEKGGGGIGDPMGGGGAGDNTLFSPRNITYLIEAKQGTSIHVIIEPFNVETSLTLLNPYGQAIAAYSSLELLTPIEANGTYKLIVATRDKGTNGKFNLIFAGNIISPPKRETPVVFLEKQNYSAAFKKEFKINIHQTSYFDFFIASSENRCSVSILDASKNRITNAPNPWDRTIVRIEDKTIIYGLLECQNHSNGFYDLGFFGDFEIIGGGNIGNNKEESSLKAKESNLQIDIGQKSLLANDTSSEYILKGNVKGLAKSKKGVVIMEDIEAGEKVGELTIDSGNNKYEISVPYGKKYSLNIIADYST